MLENLSGHICVSRHMGQNQALWTCYEPLTSDSQSRRQMWKRLTGLLSTAEMAHYLQEQYHSSEVSNNFSSVSN